MKALNYSFVSIYYLAFVLAYCFLEIGANYLFHP